jgi:GAF domain-containing protein/anti-sigma regulatory factor (Ser/Thr protein kinase)
MGVQDLRRQLTEISILHAVAVTGAGALDEDELIERITQIVGETLYPDEFGVLLLDPTDGLLHPHPSYRTTASPTSIPLGEGITGRVAQDGQPRCVSDVSQDDDYLKVASAVHSEICVPLKSGEKILGVLNAESAKVNAFAKDDERLLMTLAGQLATAIDRLRQMGASEKRNQKISAIYEIGRQITTLLSLQQLLPQAARLIAETLHFDYVRLANIEDDHIDSCAEYKAQQGIVTFTPDPKRPLAENVTDQTAAKGVPLLIPDLAHAALDPQGLKHGAQLIVPLTFQEETIGLLEMRSECPYALTRDDVTLMEILAAQIAVAVKNAQLYEASRHRAQELEGLYEIALATSSVLEPEELLRRLSIQIQQLIAPDHFFMVLYDNKAEEINVALSIAKGSARPRSQNVHVPLSEGGLTGWVMRQRQALLVNDLPNETLPVEPKYIKAEVRAWLGVPLLAHNQLVGALSVQSKEKEAFDEFHRRFLESLAHQVAIALANAQLHRDAVQTAQRLAVLHWAGQEIISISADPQEVYRAIHEATSRLMDSEAFVIALLNERESAIDLVYLVDRNGHHPPQRLSVDQGLSGHVIRTERSLRTGNIREVEDDLNVIHFGDEEHVRSVVAVPLKLRGNILGILSAQSYQADAYTQDDQNLLEMLASHAAIALENARLFKAERERSAELEAVRQASLQLTSSLELIPVLQAILENAIKLVQADDAHVFLYDGRQLKFGAARWADGERHEAFARPRQEGITYTVARSGTSMVVEDMTQHPRYEDTEWEGAIVALPLLSGEEVIGVMNIAYHQPHTYTENEIRALGLLADQAAIAIQNARLFAESEAHAAELSEALVRLRELDQLKSQFIQNTSHELRTPLTIIRGHAEILENGDLSSLSPSQIKSIQVIARRSRQLSKTIEDLTTILQTESEEWEKEPVDLVAVLNELTSEFKTRAVEAGVHFDIKIEPQEAWVNGNALHLRRVLDNLVDNAIKFTPDEGDVSVHLTKDGGYTHIKVTDTGIGVPEDQLTRIFDRFYQVDGSMTRRYGGTGLGLALVKEIVEAHQGKVSVESTAGKGSTFHIALPNLRRTT